MNILITNDDGILAEGLSVLRRALEPLGTVWVVAPEREQSGTSHALTLHHPLRIRQLEERVFAVDGTPTDCVILACRGESEFLGASIDLVVSGINHGPNMCGDIIYSGTVAAAIEGRLLSLPSLAISSESWGPGGFECAGEVARFIAEKVIENGLPPGVILNVNAPKCPYQEIRGYRITRLGKKTYSGRVVRKTDPRGRPYYWIGEERAASELVPGFDDEALANRYVSVTPIHLDLTDDGSFDSLAQWGLPIGSESRL